MKSVKPGRGPSMMSAAGSVFAVLFGIIWTAAAMFSGAPFFFPLFGICFIGLAIAQAVYSFKNATSKNRYSAFDIVDEGEEPDPLNERFAAQIEAKKMTNSSQKMTAEAARFCPYCGTPADSDFEFCKNCGKKLPD